MANRFVLAVASLALCSCLQPFSACQAQQPWGWGQSNQSQNGQQPKRERKPEHKPSEFVTQELKTPPQLPYLPQYSGKEPKFKGGFYTPNLTTARVYSMQYLCKESPDQVVTWWQNALSGTGWTINKETLRPGGFQARIANQAKTIIVMCNKTSSAGYRTTLNIRYMDAARQ